jgi:hypothetical protein
LGSKAGSFAATPRIAGVFTFISMSFCLGTSLPMTRCFWTKGDARPFHEVPEGTRARWFIAPEQREDAMATKQNEQIVESATEARQAEPGPSVLALLSMSTGLAVIILAVVWFVFFRT